MAIVQRDNVQIFLLKKEDRQTAKEMSLRISVNHIEQLYKELKAKEGEIIHPEGKLETKPWGMKEFVVIDPMGVCLTGGNAPGQGAYSTPVLTFCEPVKKQ